jgi:multidrug transporter EmrE-like cation transporter
MKQPKNMLQLILVKKSIVYVYIDSYMKLATLSWLILGTIISALVVLLIKRYTISKNKMLLIFAIILQIISVFIYVEIFTTNNICTMYTFTKILSILIVLGIGILIFNEEVTTNNIIGIIFSVVALFLLL